MTNSVASLKTALASTQSYWLPELGFPASRTVEITLCLVDKPPSGWYSVQVARTD